MERFRHQRYLRNSRLGAHPGKGGKRVTSARQPLDPVYLSDILEAGGEPLVMEVVAMFLDDAPRRLRVLHEALGSGDWGAAVLSAHTIVSSSSMLGLTAVSAAARQVEHVAAEQRRPPTADLDALAATLAAARATLDSALDDLIPGRSAGR